MFYNGTKKIKRTKTKKYGRYKDFNTRLVNKKRKLEKHIKNNPQDEKAKIALKTI